MNRDPFARIINGAITGISNFRNPLARMLLLFAARSSNSPRISTAFRNTGSIFLNAILFWYMHREKYHSTVKKSDYSVYFSFFK